MRGTLPKHYFQCTLLVESNANYVKVHLHGHDFWVLASGTGTFDADTVTFQTTNGPRRDVAMLPASGYLVVAYYTDNPGVIPLIPSWNLNTPLTIIYRLGLCIATSHGMHLRGLRFSSLSARMRWLLSWMLTLSTAPAILGTPTPHLHRSCKMTLEYKLGS